MDDYSNSIKFCADVFPAHFKKIFFKVRISYQNCVNRPESVQGTLSFLYLTHLLYGICGVQIFNMNRYIYIKELHNHQEYYWPIT